MKNRKMFAFINTVILGVVVFTLVVIGFGQESNITPAAKALMDQGDEAFKKKDFDAAIALYKQAVDQAPNAETPYTQMILIYRYKILNKYQSNQDEIKSMGEFTKVEYGKMIGELEKDFEHWKIKYPNNKALLYSYSQLYLGSDYPKMEQLLFESLKLDPNYAPAYGSLAVIEEARGNNSKVLEYYKKAAETNPHDAGLGFSYIYALKENNPKLYRQKSLEFAGRFPRTDRGAQSLYWLGVDTTDQKERITLLEKLKNEFPPDKFGWSNNGMATLFKDYQDTKPAKALEFAQEMVKISNESGKKRWQDKVDFQESLIQAQSLINEKKYVDALSVLDKVKPQGTLNMTHVYLLKAEARDLSGDTTTAYNELLKQYLDEPTDSMRLTYHNLGGKLKKSPTQMTADLNVLLDAKAVAQKDLSFVRFDNGKTVSLSDYRGKVILLNFWYPFCGPCRGEAPGLQKILTKHKDKFVILSPNVHPIEEVYVMPFIKGNKYSFIPLKSNEELAENEFNAKGYPMNVLIDPQGRSLFRTNSGLRGDAFRSFELKVEMLENLKRN